MSVSHLCKCLVVHPHDHVLLGLLIVQPLAVVVLLGPNFILQLRDLTILLPDSLLKHSTVSFFALIDFLAKRSDLFLDQVTLLLWNNLFRG